jgi:hypothetical protein
MCIQLKGKDLKIRILFHKSESPDQYEQVLATEQYPKRREKLEGGFSGFFFITEMMLT